MAGEIYSSDALMLRIHQGTATTAEHGVFELGTSLDGSPIIRCEKSGRFWAIGWKELTRLAYESGITQPEAPDVA